MSAVGVVDVVWCSVVYLVQFGAVGVECDLQTGKYNLRAWKKSEKIQALPRIKPWLGPLLRQLSIIKPTGKRLGQFWVR